MRGAAFLTACSQDGGGERKNTTVRASRRFLEGAVWHKMIKVKPFPLHLLTHGPVPPWLLPARATTPRGRADGSSKKGAWVKALHRRIEEKIRRKRRGTREGRKEAQRKRRCAKTPWKKKKKRAASKRERGGWDEGSRYGCAKWRKW